jgi:hypothetical protein
MHRKHTPLKIDRNIAIHEAGHIVVAWHLGFRFVWRPQFPRPTTSGACPAC